MNGDLLPDIFLARSIYPSYVGQPSSNQLELNIQSTLGVLSQPIPKLPATTLIETTEPISDVETTNFFPSVDMHADLLINKGNAFEPLNPLNVTRRFSDCNSVAACDFDNDMDIDLYVVRSRTAENLPNHLYENQGGGSFAELNDAHGAAGSEQGRGQSVTMADYDQDGYLDLFVTNGRGMYPFSEGPDQLFRNLGSNNNWLQIDLQGTISNRDGIGARIFATTPDGKTQL